jgi:hypothetical protein
MYVQLHLDITPPHVAALKFCEQKFRHAVFQFTLTINIPPQMTVNKWWCYVRV